MARTAKLIGKACNEYRFATDGKCEVSRWLVADRAAVKWMSNVCLGDRLEVHHITGRGRSVLCESRCNLVLIDNAAHKWVEAHSPAGTLACLYAKWRKFVDIGAAGKLPFDKSMHDWNVDTMHMLVRPYCSLAGMISTLMDRVDGASIYWNYGLDLLEVLQ